MNNFSIPISDLRTRVTFQEPTLTSDAGGAKVPGYANVKINPTVWSRWIYAHGQENTDNAKKSIQRATVTIRHREDLLTPTKRTDWRLLNKGEPWEIISIDPVQDKNRWIEIVVESAKGSV